MIDKIGAYIHKRYHAQIFREKTELSLIDEFEGRVDPTGLIFDIKIGDEEWVEYHYIYISAGEYQWFRLGNVPTNYTV